MKLVKLDKINTPSNKVNFIVSSQMTKHDVKNYLEKIYKVPVADVKTQNIMGPTRTNPLYEGKVIKDADYKVAYVTLPPGQKFEFPDLKIKSASDERYENSTEDVDKAKAEFGKAVREGRERLRPGVPTFFGL